MRDMQFLPAWSPLTRQRRRLIVLQGWLILALMAGMGAYLAMSDRNIKSDVSSRTVLQAQLEQTNAQLAEMDKLEAMRRQLQRQEQIISRLGFYVEASRMLETIETLMPKAMSLTGVQLENEEKLDTSALQQAKGTNDAVVDRRLKIKMQGVCPTDSDLSFFLSQLSTIPAADQVNVTYTRQKEESNHVLREFELSFSLSLNAMGS